MIFKIVPIILAGGSGSRLWPLSRKSFPKQFLNLLDEEYTMLQKTYKRIENIEKGKSYLKSNGFFKSKSNLFEDIQKFIYKR